MAGSNMKVNDRRLSAEQLRWRCDPGRFDFQITEDLGECPIEIIGQPRAMAALKLGFDLRSDGYNIFVSGEVGTGRSTAVRKIQESLKSPDNPPDDLVYVNNFGDFDQPRILALPAGRGCAFREEMENLVEGLRKRLPALEAFRKQRVELIEAAKERHKKRLKRFERQVARQGFTVVQAQMGPLIRPLIMPMVKGKPVDLDHLEGMVEKKKFDKAEFEKLKDKHGKLFH